MRHWSTSLTGVVIFAAEVCCINGTSFKTTLFFLLSLGLGDNRAPRTASYTVELTPWLVGYLLLLDVRSTNKLAMDHPMIANNVLFHHYFLQWQNREQGHSLLCWGITTLSAMTSAATVWTNNWWILCSQELALSSYPFCPWPTWLPWRDKRWLCNTIVFDAIQTDREDVSLESILDIPKRLFLVN